MQNKLKKNHYSSCINDFLSKLSANQICSTLTLYGWGKCAALVQMSAPTVCCDSLFSSEGLSQPGKAELMLQVLPACSGAALPVHSSTTGNQQHKNRSFASPCERLPTSAHPAGSPTCANQSLRGGTKKSENIVSDISSQSAL